tara:strand:+ start:63 stop:641 length:579 start_codon:yes stop_codon:yes gene_type:complete
MNKLTKKKVIQLSFKLIEKIGWNDFSLEKLSNLEKISLDELKDLVVSKNNVLSEYSKMIDQDVDALIDIEDFKDSSVKDNLFELLMCRFESMSKYKKALQKIIESGKDPNLIKVISCNVMNSLDFYLEFSGAFDGTFFDHFKKKTLLLIYAYCFKTWLKDNSKDLSPTMSELDRLLTISEKFARKTKDFSLF